MQAVTVNGSGLSPRRTGQQRARATNRIKRRALRWAHERNLPGYVRRARVLVRRALGSEGKPLRTGARLGRQLDSPASARGHTHFGPSPSRRIDGCWSTVRARKNSPFVGGPGVATTSVPLIEGFELTKRIGARSRWLCHGSGSWWSSGQWARLASASLSCHWSRTMLAHGFLAEADERHSRTIGQRTTSRKCSRAAELRTLNDTPVPRKRPGRQKHNLGCAVHQTRGGTSMKSKLANSLDPAGR